MIPAELREGVFYFLVVECVTMTDIFSGAHQKGQWLMPVILATREAAIRRITVQGQPQQTIWEKLSKKYPI
jgi:hypothetical protein